MAALNNYFTEFLSWIPKEVVLAIFIVIFLTEITKTVVTKLEEKLEKKKGKEILLFNHKKIIMVTIWSIIAGVILVIAKVFTWSAFPLYFFAIFGGSVILYEYIVKKFNKLWKGDDN